MDRAWREREHESERLRREPAAPAPAPVEQILRLQQGAGNAAVARMLAREPQDAPALEAPSQTFSGGDLTALLAHLQDQMNQAQQEAAANEMEQRKAERADAAALPEAPAQKPGLLSKLARPARKLGSALKKAGAWLGIGKGKPAAGPVRPEAPDASAVTAGAAAAAAGAASTAETSLSAEERELRVTIAKLQQAMEDEKERLTEHLGTAEAAVGVVSDILAPAEQQEILKQQSA